MSDNSLCAQEFADPASRARMAPFWFWNCGMSAQRVQRQVGEMARAGCGGFFIHARQGLSLPYLSHAWFERVRLAVEEAARLGLEAWLYDEFPYPSGIAGGLLTAQRPELKARVLQHFDWQAEGLVRFEMPLGRVVCALAVPIREGRAAWLRWDEALDLRPDIGVVLTREQFWLWPMGHIPTNEKRFMADEGRLVLEAELPPGQWQIHVGIEREQENFKYFGCFFDPLHPDAAPTFLGLTHDLYYEYVGRHFGTTIPGIFTDEIEPPAWSPQIQEALYDELIDFAHVLPALHHDDHPLASDIRLRVRECALRLFQERWEAPIADWCRRHGLIWAAEKPTWRPSQFAAVAQPSTDAGHRRCGAPPEPLTAELRANHRAAMAAAEHQGKREVRCENFHSLGWGATLQDQKWGTDWLAAQGVNRFTPHAFYATSSGLQKHDAAPSFFEENPYWPHFRLLTDYTARLSLALSTGREKARIAVLHPMRALWRDPKPQSPARQDYEALLNALLQRHFIFHIVDAASIVASQERAGGLEIGLARYETLIVPAVDEQDAEALAAIEKARSCGLQVLAGGWLEALEPGRALSVSGEDGREIESVWAAWREAEEQEILFLANTWGVPTTVRVEVREDVRRWELWSLESGQPESLPVQDAAQGTSTCTVELAAFGSALLIGRRDALPLAAAPVAAPATRVARLDLEGEWKIELDRPNALRLNRWRAACVEGDWQGDRDDSGWAQVEASPLRYRDTVRGGWQEPVERREGVPVWYRRRLRCDFVPRDAAILIEDGAILGRWALWVNGQSVARDSFEPVTLNGGDKSWARIGELLRRGENVLALRVEDAPEMGGLRTPLHLVGGFGLRQRVVIEPETSAPFNDLAAAGCPHFSGVATYSRRIDAGSWAGCQALALPDDLGLVAQVWAGGRALGTRAWAPYRFELPVELSALEGEVELRIAVTNTLLPFYEGQQWDASRHRGLSV